MSAPKRLNLIINILVLCVIGFFLYKRIDFEDVIYRIVKINYLLFLVTVPASIFRTWLTGIRWEALHPDNNTKLTRWNYFRFSMLAHLFNLFMPGALGGDIAKTAYTINKQKQKRIKSVIAVLVDRVIGLTSILFFGLLGLLFTHEKLSFNFLYIFIIALMVGLSLTLASNLKFIRYFHSIVKKSRLGRGFVSRIINNWYESIEYYSKNKPKVGVALSLCIPIHFISFVLFYVFGLYIGINVGFLPMIFSIAVMWLITAIPVSIGGMGVREISLVWLLGMFGVLPELAVSLAFLNYINGILVSILALPLLFDFDLQNKVRADRN